MHEVEKKLSAMHLGVRKRVPYQTILKPSYVSAFLQHLWRNMLHFGKFSQIPEKCRLYS